MAISHKNGVALTGLSAVNGVTSISALNGVSATLGGGGGFVPTDLTSIIQWNEADTGAFTDSGTTPAASNNDRIAQWNDLSGAGVNLTEASFKPYWKTNVKNGLPSMAFWYGESDKTILRSSQANNTKPFSVGLVFRPKNVTSEQLILGGDTGNAGMSIDIGTSSKLRVLKQATTLIGSSTTSLVVDNWYIAIITYSSSGAFTFTINGSADGSGTSDQTFSNTQTLLGTSPSETSLYFRGDLLALVKTSAVMTSGEIADLTAYWNTKYAIY